MAGYPTGGDIKSYLTGAGLAVPGAQELDRAARQASAQFETLVGWDPYLAQSEETSRLYTPPEWDTPLDLKGAWVEVTEVRVGVSYSSTGTALVETRDYVLGDDGDTIKFLTTVPGGFQSVMVTGKRGKVEEVPDDVFGAVLGRGVLYAASAAPSGDGPLKKRTQGPVTFEYATDTHLSRFSQLADAFNDCWTLHKRMTL